MKVERTPFTTFDFIGYFIPGFIALYLIYLTFNIDFFSILTEDGKNITALGHGYEYMVFSLFILLISWFLGHLLSFASHILQLKAIKIYNNTRTCKIFDLLDQGKRKIFLMDENKYNKMVDYLYGKYCPDFMIKNKSDNFENEFDLSSDLNKKLFLKSMTSYISTEKDTENSQIVYNYLVIQGAFRALTFILLLHFALILFIYCNFTLGSECRCLLSSLFEKAIVTHSGKILLFEIVAIYACWSIYLKYYRRQIEENLILLLSKIPKNDAKNSKSETPNSDSTDKPLDKEVGAKPRLD